MSQVLQAEHRAGGWNTRGLVSLLWGKAQTKPQMDIGSSPADLVHRNVTSLSFPA